MSGLFITFEGGEGSGKSTQLRLLATYLRTRGEEVVETRDPGGTAIGKEIRTLLLSRESGAMSAVAELLLYEASRAQLVREVIKPALARGAVVACDRFTDSTVAYQGFGRGLDLDLIRRLNRLAADGLTPDLTILLDLDPGLGLGRSGRSGRSDAVSRDRIEAEPLAFHERVRTGYLEAARREPDRFRVIDASLTAPEIARIVREAVERVRRSRLGCSHEDTG